MALSEQSIIDKIEILEDGRLQVRRADRVLRDGVVIAETYHREVLEPGADVSAKDARVKQAAQAFWTDDVKAAFAATRAQKG